MDGIITTGSPPMAVVFDGVAVVSTSLILGVY